MINIEEIKRLADTMKNYSNGMQYYKGGRVEITEVFDDLPHGETGYIGEAAGSRVYEFQITDYGSGVSYQCSCPASLNYPDRACKHVVGGLLKIYYEESGAVREVVSREERLLRTKESGINSLIKKISKRYEAEEDKKEIGVTYQLKSKMYSGNDFELQIKLGTDKLYIVRRFFDFYEALEGGEEEIPINKSLTLDLGKYKFSDRDKSNFKVIGELLSLVREISYHGEESNLRIRGPLISMFFHKFCGNIKIDDEEYKKAGIEEVDLLVKDGDSYRNTNYTFLDDEGRYITLGDKIVEIDEKYLDVLLLLNLVQEAGGAIQKKKQKEVDEIIKLSGMSVGIRSHDTFKPRVKIGGDRKKLTLKLEIDDVKEIDGVRHYLIPDKKSFEWLSGVCVANRIEDLMTEGYDEMRGVAKISTFLYYNEDLLRKMVNLEIESKEVPVKHEVEGELLLDIYKKSDKLELSLGIEGVTDEELESIFRRVVVGIDTVYLDDKTYKIKEDQARLISELRRLGIDQPKNTISDYDMLKLSLIDPSLPCPIKDQIEHLVGRGSEKPPKIDAKLRNYQKKGYSWLRNRYDSGLGGILADDMGLGKTIQMISLLTHIYIEKKVEKPSILIVPKSLLHNWKKEIKKFSGKLDIVVVEGSKGEREAILQEDLNNKLIITTYGTYKNDVKYYNDMSFEVAVLDEGQRIKNPKAKISQQVKEIKASVRYILSGTPIENNIYDLWSLFDFTCPNYLGTLKNFKDTYVNRIAEHEREDTLKSLKKIVSPFILRRLKKDVLKELPDKIESNLIIDLEKNQKKQYLSFLEKSRDEARETIDKEGFNKSRVKLLSLLTRLRQVCCSPELFIENYKGGSSKVDALIEILLEMKESGHKVLVFSQFTKIFDLLTDKLEKNSLSYFILDGKTRSRDRVDMCEQFNRGEKDLFLISLKAGGTGLNLTKADVVVHFDPWWNPAIENQATDRAHRIGQENVVQVIKMVAENTIEEKVLEIQEKKRALIEAMADGGKTSEVMTQKDFEELLGL